LFTFLIMWLIKTFLHSSACPKSSLHRRLSDYIL